MDIGMQSRVYELFGQEKYRKMYEDGFRYCDLGLSNTKKEPYNCDEEEFQRLMQEELALAKEAGIIFSQVHGPWRYPPQDATSEDRAERKEKMEMCFRAAKIVECPYVVIHPIMPYGTKEDPDPETMFRMNVEFFSSLIPAARENGVTICIENMPMKMLSLSSPAETLRLVRAITDPNVAFCLDTGHAMLVGHDLYDVIRVLGDRITVLHVHDNGGINDDHMFPYMGITDWDRFCEGLKSIGYDRPLSFETFNALAVADKAVWPEMLTLLHAIGKRFAAKIEGE